MKKKLKPDELTELASDSILMDISSEKGKKKKIRKHKEKAWQPQPSEQTLEHILQAGRINLDDILAPSSINMRNRDYIEVDRVYFAYLYIAGYGYPSQVSFAWLSPLLEAGEGINLSFTLKRQPKEKILSKISQSTKLNRTRMREVEDTRADFEELDSAITAGLFLKDSINRNNEDFYYMHTVLEVYADDLDTLEKRTNSITTLCMSMDFLCKRCDYRQDQAFTSALPLLALDPEIERKSRRNILTSSVAASFPFTKYGICDKSGILLGLSHQDGSLTMVDPFDATKYPNGNFCLLGTSGSGKTSLIQSMAMRFRQQGITTVIIAPIKGHEFRLACERMGQYTKIAPSSPDCVNIMEIRRTSLDPDIEIGSYRNDSVLAEKIQRLHLSFLLQKPDISYEERNCLDTALLKCYREFDITHDNNRITHNDGAMKTMPTLKDLYYILNKNEKSKPLTILLERFVHGSLKSLSGKSTIDTSSKYHVFDLSEMDADLQSFGMFSVVDFFIDLMKRSRIEKIALFADELWNLIGPTSSPLVAAFIVELFKTIRAYGGIILGATQELKDINNLNATDGVNYGKTVLNVSHFKILLSMEQDEINAISEPIGLTEAEKLAILRYKTGSGLFAAGRNRLGINFHLSQMEYDLITTRRQDLEKKALRYKK